MLAGASADARDCTQSRPDRACEAGSEVTDRQAQWPPAATGEDQRGRRGMSSTSGAIGSAKPNSAPPPSRDRAQMRPPSWCTILRQTARPMPTPPAVERAVLASVERFEQVVRRPLVKTDPAIEDEDADLVLGFLHEHLDRRALRAVLGGVANQVLDEQFEVRPLGLHDHGRPAAEGDRTVGMTAPNLLDRPLDDAVERRRLELGRGARPEPGQGEQVLDDLVEAFRLGGDVGQHRVALRSCEPIAPVLEQSGIAEDRCHRRPQLVRHEPQELVLHRVRRLELGQRGGGEVVLAGVLFGSRRHLGPANPSMAAVHAAPCPIVQIGHAAEPPSARPGHDSHGSTSTQRNRALAGARRGVCRGALRRPMPPTEAGGSTCPAWRPPRMHTICTHPLPRNPARDPRRRLFERRRDRRRRRPRRPPVRLRPPALPRARLPRARLPRPPQPVAP